MVVGAAELSKMGKCLEGIPLLKGEGGPKGRVRGEKMLLFTPHPPLRGTLSLQERDARIQVPIVSSRPVFLSWTTLVGDRAYNHDRNRGLLILLLIPSSHSH